MHCQLRRCCDQGIPVPLEGWLTGQQVDFAAAAAAAVLVALVPDCERVPAASESAYLHILGTVRHACGSEMCFADHVLGSSRALFGSCLLHLMFSSPEYKPMAVRSCKYVSC